MYKYKKRILKLVGSASLRMIENRINTDIFFEEEKKERKTPLSWIQDIMIEDFISFEELGNKDYNIILLDLLLYKEDNLVNNAISLLDSHYSQ